MHAIVCAPNKCACVIVCALNNCACVIVCANVCAMYVSASTQHKSTCTGAHLPPFPLFILDWFPMHGSLFAIFGVAALHPDRACMKAEEEPLDIIGIRGAALLMLEMSDRLTDCVHLLTDCVHLLSQLHCDIVATHSYKHTIVAQPMPTLLFAPSSSSNRSGQNGRRELI